MTLVGMPHRQRSNSQIANRNEPVDCSMIVNCFVALLSLADLCGFAVFTLSSVRSARTCVES